MKTTDPQDEIFPIVDENDNVLGKITRREAHGKPDLIHRAVHIIIFDYKGRVIIQKRSLTKDTSPGKLCNSVSGHVGYYDDYLNAAQRETKEELGIEIGKEDLIPLGKIITVAPWEKEMTQVYKVVLKQKVDLHPNPDEVSEIILVEPEKLKNLLLSEEWTPSTGQILKKFILGE